MCADVASVAFFTQIPQKRENPLLNAISMKTNYLCGDLCQILAKHQFVT